MTNFRLLLIFSFFSVPFGLLSQQEEACEPGFLEAIDDVIELDEADISFFSFNVLDNDFIGFDNFQLEAENLPPCISFSDNGTVEINNPSFSDGDGDLDCCGVHTFSYSIFTSNGLFCSAEVIITIECGEESKGDCSFIDLSSIKAQDGPDTPSQGFSPCIPVCGGSLTTITYTYDPNNVYEYTIVGGSIDSQNGSNEIIVQWDETLVSGTIILEVSNDSGSETIIQCIDILPPPVANFEHEPITCLGSSTQFTSLSNPQSADHFWEFGDGITSSMVNPTHAFDSPGIYEITLTVTAPILNDSGAVVCCCTDLFTSSIEVLDVSGPKIECISTICAGDSACYSTPSGCLGADYLWEVFDANGNNISFDGNGTEEVCVGWGDGPHGTVQLQILNCPDICDIPTSVVIPIISTQALIDGPIVVCEYEAAVYSVPKWMDVVYDWQVLGAQSYSVQGNEVTVVWGHEGVGTINVSYESPFLQQVDGHEYPDCSGSGEIEIAIQPQLEFTSIPQAGCAGQASFFATNSNDVIWSVDPTANLLANGNQCTIDWTTPGIYTVKAAAMNPANFCNDFVSHTVVVTQLDPPSIQGPANGCAGVPLLYFVDNPANGVNYFWVAIGGTLNTNTGTNVTVDWATGTANQQLTLYASQASSPYCSASTMISFSEDTPQVPIIGGSGDVCANTISDFFIDLPSILVGETFEWSITPAEAGSIISNQGSSLCSVQWNDFSGMASLHVVSSLCDFSESGQLPVNVSNLAPPVINQSGTLCINSSQPLTLSTPQNYASYAWSPAGPGSTSNSFVVNNPGLYQLSVTDANGCEATAYTEVNSVAGPTASITSPQSSALCIPSSSSVIELFTMNHTNWNYAWNGNPGGTSNESHVIQNSAGTYTYTVVVTDSSTGCQASDSYTIIEQTCTGSGPGGNPTCTPAELLDLSLTQTCNSVDVTVNASSASNINYNFGDGSSSSSSNHTYTSAACFVITVSADVTDNNNATQTCNIQEDIGVCIPVASAFEYSNQSCNTVQFNDLSSCLQNPNPLNQISQWAWDFDDGNASSSQQNPVHTFSGPGTYDVTLTATDSDGCSASSTQQVTIGTAGQPLLNYDGIVCVGESETFAASALNAVDYQWLFSDGTAFNGQTIEYTYTSPLLSPNSVTITATDAYGCSATETFPINPVDPPEIFLNVAPDPAIVCPLPGTAILTATPPTWPLYEWQDSNGNILTEDALGAAINPLSNDLIAGDGEFSVLSEFNGCPVASDPVLIQVSPEQPVALNGPTIFCGDGIAQYQYLGNYASTKWIVDGAFAASNQPSFQYQGFVGQTVNVQLQVTDNSGCDHLSDIISTTWQMGVDFELNSQSNPPCAGEEVTIEVSNLVAGSPVEVYWNTGQVGTEISTYNAGIYTATVHDSEGCSSSESFEVFPIPDLCSVPNGCYSSCEPVEICGPDGLSSYQWFLNGSATPGSDPCILLDQSGNYSLYASNSFGCFANSMNLEFTLEDCSCDAEFTATPSGDGCCHVISFENNSTIFSDNIDFHTPGNPGNFSVIDPDYSILVTDPLRMTLTHNSGSIPNGILTDIIEICPDIPAISPISVEITLSKDTLFTCAFEIFFDCESDTTNCEPFVCENSLYQVFGNDGQIGAFNPGISGSLMTVLPNSYDDGNNAPSDLEDSMNAVGFSKSENYAFGFALNGLNEVVLVRIGADGCVEDLGRVVNHPNNVNAQDSDFLPSSLNTGTFFALPNQGDFTSINPSDAEANAADAWINAGIPLPSPLEFELLHVREFGNEWVNIVDVVTKTVVYTYFLNGNAAGFYAADFAFHASDGVFYGVEHGFEQLLSIDPSNGFTQLIGNPGDAVGGSGLDCNSWGAAYSDLNGSLFATCNGWIGTPSDNTFQINSSTGLGAPVFDTGSGTVAFNDGFSCPDVVIPVDPQACLTFVIDSLPCVDQNTSNLLEFEVCNDPNSNFNIGYFSISVSNSMNAQLNASVFDLPIGSELLPGDCGTFNSVLTDFDGSNELCIIISAHEENPADFPETTCCIVESCVPVGPCEEDCAIVEYLDATCINDQWMLDGIIWNNSNTTVGYVELIYSGINGMISDINSVNGIPHGDPIFINEFLSPFATASQPFCIEIVLHEFGPAGSLVECCSITHCIELPECGPETIAGCTDEGASNFDAAASTDDGSCTYCISPGLIDLDYNCPSDLNEVCGCNGITYVNLCYAIHMGGVISWTNGPCDNGNEADDDGPTPSTCATDVNMDGTTNVGDLLMILGEFGIECD
jgi:PKD repeat protein